MIRRLARALWIRYLDARIRSQERTHRDAIAAMLRRPSKDALARCRRTQIGLHALLRARMRAGR